MCLDDRNDHCTLRPPLATHSLSSAQRGAVGSPINAVRGKQLSAAATSANDATAAAAAPAPAAAVAAAAEVI
jgi:hypothetical protein